jgi:hypothetical protein
MICFITVIIFALGVTLVSCNQDSFTETAPDALPSKTLQPSTSVTDIWVNTLTEDEVARISKEELLEKLNVKANVLVIDIRDESNYELEHISGAVNVALSALEEGKWEPPLNTELIIYCG